jgi:signal recognition particle GTPase
VNQLLKQFGQMKKMMRQLQSGRMPDLQQLAGGR